MLLIRRTRRFVRRTLIGASFAILAIFGCRQPETPPHQIVYLRHVADSLKELTKSGQRFGTSLNPWLQGDELDVDALDADVAAAERTLADVRATIDSLSVPDDEASRRFAAEVEEYLAFQAEAIEVFGAWAATAKAENPASFETRRRVAEDLATRNEEEIVRKAELDTLAERIEIPTRP